jgi:hypothetical protein
MQQTPFALALAVSLIALSACELPDDPSADGNPLDPDSPGYEKPIVEIVEGPEEGSSIESADVPFTWSGNLGVDEYRYWVDSDRPTEWNEWGSGKSVTLRQLDEGEHVFHVEGRRSGTGETSPSEDRRTFTVDAVPGPSLMFRPRRAVVEPGKAFTVEVVAEEVTDLMFVRAVIRFDPAMLEVDASRFDEFLGDEHVFLERLEEGLIDLNMAATDGAPRGLTGTIAILRCRLRGNTEATMEFLPSSKMRDPDGNDIDIKQRVPAVIVVR